MKRHSLTILAATGLILLATGVVEAQRGRGASTGMGHEVIKPEIVTVSGTLERIETGPCQRTTGHAFIGTHLYLRADTGRLLNIHLGAAYAVESFVDKLETGRTIEVEGFRTEKLEQDHYVAKTVTADGRTMKLRDDDLRPVWAGGARDFREDRRSRRFSGRRGDRW